MTTEVQTLLAAAEIYAANPAHGEPSYDFPRTHCAVTALACAEGIHGFRSSGVCWTALRQAAGVPDADLLVNWERDATTAEVVGAFEMAAANLQEASCA